MSFGFGGNNNTSTGFGSGGGFGASNTGFGASNNTSTSGSLFGGGNTATSGGFGGGGGFGAGNTSSPFGAKPATGFGATATSTGGGLFGGNTSTSGGFGASGGGFGASNNTSTGFGASNTGGGMFGQNKPATTGFGGGNTGGSIFGGGSTSGGFGNNANNTSSNPFSSNTGSTGFGASNTTNNTSTGFGGFGGSTSTATTTNTNTGTGTTPFTAFQEKDAASNQTSHYQSITFQQPYANKSFEELRVEDYLQGRRYGNTNGQAGSFGQSTGFGGGIFGNNNNTTNTSTSGGLFGNNNNTATTGSTGFGGFGANNGNNQPSTGGFGASTTSGGLFGQNKPATGGGLFGATQTSGTTTGGFGGSTSGSGGGLFGGGGGGFGANNTTSSTGGGLFGNNANNTQNKPAFGGFGGNNNTSTGGFGGNTSTGGGLFGGSNTNNNTSTGGGLFGANNNNNNQPPQSNPFGASTSTGGGLFGNNQNKPATGGLFGGNTNTSTTSGGLFGGSTNNQPQSGGLFGNNNQPQSGGLFGNNQNKPATGGLFGNNTANTNSGGLFGGGSNNQQPAGSSLFGGNNNNSGSSLFGNSQNKPAGSSLFGGNTGANAGSSFFGNNNSSNQPNNPGTSLFGGSLGNNQGNAGSSLFGVPTASAPQQNQLHASLTASPYGNDQLFSSLGQTSAPVGPLATPLNGAKPTPSKTPSLLSSTRLNSPIYTPRASAINRAGTYGMSFSTYGTPGSAYSSSLTPQQSSLLKPTGSLGSALTSRLAKSMSMNNLRPDGTPREGESLLRPTPGSTSSKYLQSGSMRKLIIDRSLRTDLFASPEPTRQLDSARNGVDADGSDLRKRVSFDNNTGRQSNAEPSSANTLVRTEEEPEDETSPGPAHTGFNQRPQPNVTPEMQQVNGTPLTAVPEDRVPPRPTSAPLTKRSTPATSEGGEGGDYWSKPSIRDLNNMSRQQLQRIGKFTVGRDGVGSVEFSVCDLTNTNLEDICGKICELKHRAVTVYPNHETKPPRGQGLNVPATIRLEQSWPQNQSRKKKIIAGSADHIQKHVESLKKTKDTKFVSFDPKTGLWTFTVEHFTTYGFDDDDDETEDMDTQQETSGLSEPPEDETMQSIEAPSSVPEDDTFGDYKKRAFPRLPSKRVPGGFDESEFINNTFDEPSPADGADEHMMSGGLGKDDVFDDLPGGAVQAPSPSAIERYHSSMITDDDAGDVHFAEDAQAESDHDLMPGCFIAEEPKLLRSILKPISGLSTFTSPEKLATESWEDQLQRTMSPKKRDRQALRSKQQSAFLDQPADAIESPFKRSMLGQNILDQSSFGNSYLAQKSAKKVGFGANTTGADLGKSQAFRTSMDIMNSLWAQEKTTKKAPGATRGFENPYPKKPRLSASSDLDEQDAAFHDSLKPSFANNGVLVYSVPGTTPQVDGHLMPALQPLVSEHKEVRFAQWARPEEINTMTLSAQKEVTVVDTIGDFPYAQLDTNIVYRDIAAVTENTQEKAIWRLADILFDNVGVACSDLIDDTMDPDTIAHYEPRLRMDVFGEFLKSKLEDQVAEQISLASTAEEKALLRLTVNDVAGACDFLTSAKDFKLATLVAQLPGSDDSRDLMQAQIDTWISRNDWSEIPEVVRVLYSIIAGETCTVAGKNGPPENRATAFCIAEKYGLSWLQSFGLRVFFGGYASLDEAASAYLEDLKEGHEKVAPTPWWVNKDAEAQDDSEDTLLSLLKLAIGRADTNAVFNAKTITGNPVNSRVAWQLATFVASKRQTDSLSDEKMDILSVNFAAELEAAGAFVTAAWVLLHLRDSDSRKKAVTELLFRNAEYLGEPKAAGDAEDGTWEFLAVANKLPQELLWSAKALHSRAELGNAYLQTKYLLNARAINEAHEVLCNTIGPQAVIEEDYDALQEILPGFSCKNVQGWVQGGQVFEDFVTLVTMPQNRKHSNEGGAVMERLGLGLQAMAAKEENMALEGRVALVEIERVLKEEMREEAMGMEGVEVGMGAFDRYRQALGVVA